MISERTDDGARAVFVFDDPLTAEAFLILENLAQDLGRGWEVIEHTPLDAANLLKTCAGEDVRYVLPNPPSALSREDEQELQLIPVWTFIDYLLGE
jgi:hypothetical protein